MSQVAQRQISQETLLVEFETKEDVSVDSAYTENKIVKMSSREDEVEADKKEGKRKEKTEWRMIRANSDMMLESVITLSGPNTHSA